MSNVFEDFMHMFERDELRGVTSHHILEAEAQEFAYRAQGFLQSVGYQFKYDEILQSIEQGTLQFQGVWIRVLKGGPAPRRRHDQDAPWQHTYNPKFRKP